MKSIHGDNYNYLATKFDTGDVKEKTSTSFKNIELKLLLNFKDLDKSEKIGVLNFAGILNWYEAVDPLLEIAENLIKEEKWEIDYEYLDRGVRFTLFAIASSLIKISFPPDRLQEYSDRIYKNIVEASRNSAYAVKFIQALAAQGDKRSHEVLKEYLKKGVNVYDATFDAVIYYKDPSDLPLIEKYTSGIHVPRGHLAGSNADLLRLAKRAYKKLQKEIEKQNKLRSSLA